MFEWDISPLPLPVRQSPAMNKDTPLWLVSKNSVLRVLALSFQFRFSLSCLHRLVSRCFLYARFFVCYFYWDLFSLVQTFQAFPIDYDLTVFKLTQTTSTFSQTDPFPDLWPEKEHRRPAQRAVWGRTGPVVTCGPNIPLHHRQNRRSSDQLVSLRPVGPQLLAPSDPRPLTHGLFA